jgi:hypothetical protein
MRICRSFPTQPGPRKNPQMKTFMILYQTAASAQGFSAAEAMANASPEQMKAGMALWRRWRERCGNAIVDLGGAVTLEATGATDASSAVSGYTILQADSKEEAIGLMADHPHFHAPGASILVLEAVQMPPSVMNNQTDA